MTYTHRRFAGWSARRPTGFAVVSAAARIAIVALLLFTVPVSSGSARADDPAEALTFFESRLAASSKTCVEKLWDVAERARGSNLHELAYATAQEIVLEWNPDHAESRKLLGFVKKGRDWTPDPDAKVQKLNSKNEKESQASFDEKIRKWKEARAKVRKFVAEKYAQIGAECEAKGYAEQTRKCAERALSLDPDCAPARKTLGYEKFGAIWVTREKAAAIQRAVEGKPVTGPSELEKALGISLHKLQTAHFRVEDDKSPDSLPEAVKGLETLYAYYLADVGRDPTEDIFGGKVVEMCIVSSQPLWEKWVDAISKAKDPKWVKESNTYKNYTELRTGVLRVETAEHVDTRDPLLHHAAHLLNQIVWKAAKHAWIDEGLAYYYTVKLQDTTRTHCVGKLEGDAYANKPELGGDKDWAVSEGWKIYLRDWVKKKNDPELRKLMTVPLATLDLPSSVKCWAVLSWLMETKRDRTLTFLKALRDRKDPAAEPQEPIFEKTFATSIELVDKEWRAYALRAY